MPRRYVAELCGLSCAVRLMLVIRLAVLRLLLDSVCMYAVLYADVSMGWAPHTYAWSEIIYDDAMQCGIYRQEAQSVGPSSGRYRTTKPLSC